MNVFFIFGKSRGNSEEKRCPDKKKSAVISNFAVVGAAVLCLVFSGLAMRVPAYAFCEETGRYSLKASSEMERVDFFLQFGYKAKEEECAQVVVPSRGEVLGEYNEIQKSQGMNIMPYSGRKAWMYVYRVIRAGEEFRGYLVVYKERVVAAHICDCTYPAQLRGLV